MNLSIQIKEIDFFDVIRKAKPVLQEKAPNDGSATAKIIDVVTKLPEDVIHTMLNAVPYQDKCEIVALLLRENKEKIQAALSQQLKKYEIYVSLDSLVIRDNLELSVAVSNLDYAALASKYLPLVRDGLIVQENPITAMLAALLKLPGMLLVGAISKIPQTKKDEAVAYLINKNSGAIIEKIEGLLQKQDIHIKFENLKVET